MATFLKWYLLITGALALIAVTMPSLVVIGLFLIVPGLILGLAPTAFVWGCIYAAIYWLLRIVVGERVATLVAIPVLAAAIWAIPQPSISLARVTVAKYDLTDMAPAQPIRPVGDIRIDSASVGTDNGNYERGEIRRYSCDNRCLALLFEPGVRSVTVNGVEKLSFEQVRDGVGPLLPAAQTYRLLPKGKCDDGGHNPDIESRHGQFGKTLEDNRAMSADWKLRLIAEVCLQGDPPIAHHDLLLRMGRWSSDLDRNSHNTSWSLIPNGADADFAEARTGTGKLLMRVFNLRTYALSMPLFVNGTGGLENFRFGWGRSVLPKGTDTGWEQPQTQLDAALDVRRTPDRSHILDSVRSSLLAAVNDPSLPADAPIFKTVGDYLQLLKEQGATAADRPLVERLILDSRLDDLDAAWSLIGTFPDDYLNALRPAIARKLLSLPDTVDPQSGQLGKVLLQWPKGVFAHLNADELKLLADVERRRRANGLITRLADMGAPAASMLARIIEYHQSAY